MKTKFALLAIITLAFSGATHAGSVALGFDVSVTSKFLNDLSSNTKITFRYNVIVSFDSVITDQGVYDDGRHYFFQHFNSSIIPATPLTNDVLSHSPQTLDTAWLYVGIWRAGIERAEDGGPFTQQIIYLYSDASSQSVNNVKTNYGRGIEFSENPEGFQVTQFTESTFTSYMTSLMGNSNFSFYDSIGSQEYFPDTDTSLDTYRYGYSGTATLVSVTPIPEPGTLALIGIGFIILVRRAVKNIP